jgi:hypothetical protein
MMFHAQSTSTHPGHGPSGYIGPALRRTFKKPQRWNSAFVAPYPQSPLFWRTSFRAW